MSGESEYIINSRNSFSLEIVKYNNLVQKQYMFLFWVHERETCNKLYMTLFRTKSILSERVKISKLRTIGPCFVNE